MTSHPPVKAYSPEQTIIVALIISAFVHAVSGGGLSLIRISEPEKKNPIVKMRVIDAPAPRAEEIPPPPPKKERPKKQNPTPNQQVAPNAPTTEVPVQGLNKDSLSPAGTMAAPVGNTLMVEDKGLRLKDVEALRGDLSAPAKLIAASLTTPPYTDEALDALLEGSFIVDVYVNLDGTVREADLRRKIGYGMDVRVLNAVKSAKFIPRKNKFGTAEEGWTELKFTLVIP